MTIIDVRTIREFDRGSIDGSVNIPLGEIPHKVDYLKTLLKPLVFCCASGNRSSQAVNFLNTKIDDVHNGGGWINLNISLNEK